MIKNIKCLCQTNQLMNTIIPETSVTYTTTRLEKVHVREFIFKCIVKNHKITKLSTLQLDGEI